MKSGFECLRRISGSKQPSNYNYLFDDKGDNTMSNHNELKVKLGDLFEECPSKVDTTTNPTTMEMIEAGSIEASFNGANIQAATLLTFLEAISGEKVPYRKVRENLGKFNFVPEALDVIFEDGTINVEDKISALLVYISANQNIRKCHIKEAIYKTKRIYIDDSDYYNRYHPESRYYNQRIMGAFISNCKYNIKKSRTMAKAFHDANLDEIAISIIDNCFSDDLDQVKDILRNFNWNRVIRPRLDYILKFKGTRMDVCSKYAKYIDILSTDSVVAFGDIVGSKDKFDDFFELYGELNGLNDESLKELKIKFVKIYSDLQIKALIDEPEYDADAVQHRMLTNKLILEINNSRDGLSNVIDSNIIDELDLVDFAILRYPSVAISNEFLLRNFNAIKTDKAYLIDKMNNFLFYNIEDNANKPIHCILFSMSVDDIVRNFYKLKPTLEDIGYVPGRPADTLSYNSIKSIASDITVYLHDEIKINGPTAVNTALAFIKWLMFESDYVLEKDMFSDFVESILYSIHRRSNYESDPHILRCLRDFSKKLVKTWINFILHTTKRDDLIAIGSTTILSNINRLRDLIGDPELHTVANKVLDITQEYIAKYADKDFAAYRINYTMVSHDLLGMQCNNKKNTNVYVKGYGHLINMINEFLSNHNPNLYYKIPYNDNASTVMLGEFKKNVWKGEVIHELLEDVGIVKALSKNVKLDEEALDLLFD